MGVGINGARIEPLGDVDLVSPDHVRELVRAQGPCVSVFLPTSRFGPETLSGPMRLRHLLEEAAGELAANGTDEGQATAILAPLQALLQNEPFWQRQSDGLALYSAPGVFAHFRVPMSLPEEASVGPSFRLRPLLSLMSADGVFYVLALSQNSVRLFQATRQTIGEVPLGAVPRSMSEAIPQEEMERHGQAHSTGPTTTQFHGQGSEADYEKAALERYFRAIDHPLTALLGNGDEPLVLACVGYYLPVYKQVSRYKRVWDKAVEGNPERRAVGELHTAAWTLVADHFAEREERHLDRYRTVAGTGRTASGAEEVLAAARDGRVDTLLLGPGTGQADMVVESALAETLRHDGRVVSVSSATDLVDTPAALLRY